MKILGPTLRVMMLAGNCIATYGAKKTKRTTACRTGQCQRNVIVSAVSLTYRDPWSNPSASSMLRNYQSLDTSTTRNSDSPGDIGVGHVGPIEEGHGTHCPVDDEKTAVNLVEDFLLLSLWELFDLATGYFTKLG